VKFIVGLGNPGRHYEKTRHNIGFLVLDELASRMELSFRRSWRVPAQIAKGVLGGESVRLVKPQTFMNRSGQAVGALLRKEGGTADDLILVFDEAALDWRAQGSAGGHNGVQSVLNVLGDGAFSRIRVGIGPKPDRLSLSDYVLGPFSAAERKSLEEIVWRAADAVEMSCNVGVEQAMNCFNGVQEQGERN